MVEWHILCAGEALTDGELNSDVTRMLDCTKHRLQLNLLSRPILYCVMAEWQIFCMLVVQDGQMRVVSQEMKTEDITDLQVNEYLFFKTTG
jgi:hypothetical protein